ncbi:hypothetical protein OUZ56_024700 [Daphnia magna]|uniref:Uncharacterized protein n=1 Tax=Daphnia magna TaxID=35525 RepID=A0ABQ9ZHR3_9CRUS|nr:hypothetical protein OUZ56_024700 [Daphnia magna]
MQVKCLCVLFTAIIGSVISVSVDPSNVFHDNHDEWVTRQLNLVTRQLVTNTTTVNIACAKLVNVTGPCRRRRGLWLEEPIVLSFDEETEKLTEILFTPPYRMETTEIPNTSVIDFTSESPSGATVTNIEDGRLVPSMRESRDLDLPHSRIYFPFVLSLVTRFISALTAGRPSVPIGGNSTLTGGVLPIFVPSQTVTVTVTNTFFVQLCTPSPFPFSECIQFRKRN